MLTRVIISVSGGVVNAVYSNGKHVKVHLVDFDNLESEPGKDCSTTYLIDSLHDFQNAAQNYIERYPEIGKLLSYLKAEEQFDGPISTRKTSDNRYPPRK
ncbi:MAG: hypothetical protein A3A86_05945 [Elusimicrobia bacterium RIFCSPLOWO2_01_FULL_60_11]|nr:MAG: hypothetical protein A3A86_05945 [Elusimicrobia bacterium RIFCSPLOWO2_01_FULL_60_11]